MASSKKAYTVMEVIIASAIFILFAGAAFSLYRMGSRMYVSGSWKYNRQKEAELFFQNLRERVEQTSELVTINLPTTEVSIEQTNFVINKKKIKLEVGQKASGREYLAQFAVCKPCRIEEDNKVVKGLVLFHGLTLIANNMGLYDLYLYVDNNTTNSEYFNLSGESCMKTAEYTQDKFKGNPTDEEFGFPNTPHSFVLRDVYSVEIETMKSEEETISTPSGLTDDTPIIPSVFKITVGMRNPKHEQTALEMSCFAKIDGGVNL